MADTQGQMMRFLPVAFYFQVDFQGDPPIRIVAFKEVSGLSAEMELETVNEGGENTYKIKLPKGVKHGNLVMKRLVSPADSNLGLWIKDALEGGFAQPVKPRNVVVYLMNENKDPVHIWFCENCYPVKWEAEGFDAEKNTVAIESLELVYNKLTREL